MRMRIYYVEGPGLFKLIEASSKREAINYAIKGFINADIASQKLLVAAMVDGVKIESPRDLGKSMES